MAEDQVAQMPGWPKTSYNIFSGMLNANESGSRQLHYFFLESAGNPVADPLIIWLNGGPGCSSLLGLIQENGPYMFTGVNEEFTDTQEFSWNNEANVLYIESPAGVGYSTNKDIRYQYNDDNTANDMLYAYNQWLARFADSTLNLQDKPLWISGESYGGMYIPFFTNAILDQNDAGVEPKINIQGFLIGNGAFILDWDMILGYTVNTYASHQFFSNDIASDWYDGCLAGDSSRCDNFANSFLNVANNTDHYQIYNYTYSYPHGSFFLESEKQSGYILEKAIDAAYILTDSQKEKIKNGLNVNYKNTDDGDDSTDPTPESIIEQYFNKKSVQEAMHVPTKKWKMCNNLINRGYHSAPDSSHLYPNFFKHDLQMLIYSGNTDGAIPTDYTWYCIKDMISKYIPDLKVSQSWGQWAELLANEQMGGLKQVWNLEGSKSDFTLAMIRAAGHEVPEYQPLAAYTMLMNFINGREI